MGRVYLAEHVKMGRKSAVKLMSPGLALSAEATGRFHREASNASRINHPNVAAIYDFGEGEGGVLYLAMEFIEGETLSALIRREGRLPIARAASLIKQAADALAAAHHLGIVHRDLKPDNIMLTRHVDGSDWVKVVDFGIAKTTEASGRGSQTVTTAGVSIGTPDYMSPEQLAGDRLDPRTDLYSLGLVLFNMLTGDLPYPRLTSKETLVRRLTAPPRTLAEVCPELAWPPALQRALDGALAPEVGDRFADVAAFGRAVVAAANGDAEPMLAAARTVPLVTRAAAGATVPVAVATGAQPPRPSPLPSSRRMPRALAVGAIAVVGALAFVALRPRPADVASPRATIAAHAPAPADTAPASVPPTNLPPARDSAAADTTVASAPVQAGAPGALDRAGARGAPIVKRRAPSLAMAGMGASATPSMAAASVPRRDSAAAPPAIDAPARERADAAMATLQRAAQLFGQGDARGARLAMREAARDGVQFRQELAGAPIPADVEQQFRASMRQVVDSCQSAKARRASPEMVFVRCEALVQRPANEGSAMGNDSAPAAGLRARRQRFRPVP